MLWSFPAPSGFELAPAWLEAAAEAAKHAYAADAAVAAVAQVLAIKQAVALKARAEASAAAQRVHAMASLAMYKEKKETTGLGFLPPPPLPKSQ